MTAGTHETEKATGQMNAKTRCGYWVGIYVLPWKLQNQCLRELNRGLYFMRHAHHP